MSMSTFVGDTGSPLTFTFNQANGKPFDISGFTNANFALKLKNGNTILTCSGNWTVLDGPNGIAQYQPNSADIATAGAWTIQAQLIYPLGPRTMQPDTLNIAATF